MMIIPSLATDACGLHVTAVLGSDPEGQFAAWLKANKALSISDELLRHFGNLPATQYDVSIVDRGACALTEPKSIATRPGNDGLLSLSGLASGPRIEVSLSWGEQLLLVCIVASPDDFPTFEPLAEQVLDTVQFGR